MTGNIEATLNLEYVKCLKEYFENFDFKVVLTRSSSEGLYSIGATNKKKDDMQKRKEVIEGCGADVVISVHMNSYARKSSKGCQVFYDEASESSLSLANSVQDSLKNDLENAKQSPAIGDYYILNCSTIPSILLECGFLSNPEEDKLIATKEYMQKLCYSVFCGVVSYFGADNISA